MTRRQNPGTCLASRHILHTETPRLPETAGKQGVSCLPPSPQENGAVPRRRHLRQEPVDYHIWEDA
jgi:hypothetical protein